MVKKDEYLSVPQLAEVLGISRVAVFKRIKKGDIKAKKIGRNYAVPRKYVLNILGKSLGEKDKKEIDRAVAKTVKEYGETLKLLGRE